MTIFLVKILLLVKSKQILRFDGKIQLFLGNRNLIEIEEGQQQSQEEQQRRQQMLIQEEYDMEQLQERERSIRQLESDILDVNTIFKDLATLVHDQGEMIDSIEANVESTQVRVSEGTEHLRQAETYKVLKGIIVTFLSLSQCLKITQKISF